MKVKQLLKCLYPFEKIRIATVFGTEYDSGIKPADSKTFKDVLDKKIFRISTKSDYLYITIEWGD